MVLKGVDQTIYQRPVELLQQLIRFDTTNPPGNEAECIRYIDQLLTGAGIQATILAKEPDRPNLIARLPGRGNAPPLLLYAHLDVASTANQTWHYPPFEGRIVDGTIWGRGCLDMKGGAAMSLSAFLRARADGFIPPGDIVLAMLCDEEAGGGLGASYLVENHPDQFAGIRYAIGEFGGFTLYLAGRRFYPIMVAEKRMCFLRATVRGPAYHPATAVVHGGAAARMGTLLTKLDQARLPARLTPPVHQMVEVMSNNVPFPVSLVLRMLLNPVLADWVLAFLGPSGQALYPMFHNIYNIITIHSDDQMGITPAQVSTELFAGLLPGYSPEDLVGELCRIASDEVEFEVTQPGETLPDHPDMGLFDTLCEIIRESDPKGVPVPMLLTAMTDGRHFNRLGIQTYGFLPMKLPPELELPKLVHAPDERIPVEAVEFGAAAIYQLLHRLGEK